MVKLKNKLALLSILAVIGIGMVLAAYFIGISSTKEGTPGERGAEKGIAIMLDLKEEEANASASEETNEIKGKESTFEKPEVSGAADMKEEKPAARGFGEVESTGVGNESEYMEEAYAAESMPAPDQEMLKAQPSSDESLQQNMTTLNVVVMNKGQVMSNETVNLENE